MPWDDIKNAAGVLKLMEGGWREIEAQAAIVALNATPDALNSVIVLMSAENLELICHIHGEPDEAGTVQDCTEYDLPQSMKLLLIYGLMALRDRELAKQKESH